MDGTTFLEAVRKAVRDSQTNHRTSGPDMQRIAHSLDAIQSGLEPDVAFHKSHLEMDMNSLTEMG
jgi:hypothetical protein